MRLVISLAYQYLPNNNTEFCVLFLGSKPTIYPTCKHYCTFNQKLQKLLHISTLFPPCPLLRLNHLDCVNSENKLLHVT